MQISESCDYCDLHAWVRNVRIVPLCSIGYSTIHLFGLFVICLQSSPSLSYSFPGAQRQVEKFKLLEERFYFYQKYRSLHVFQDFYVIKLSNIWKLSITSILVKLLKLFKESIRVLKLYALKKTGWWFRELVWRRLDELLSGSFWETLPQPGCRIKTICSLFTTIPRACYLLPGISALVISRDLHKNPL